MISLFSLTDITVTTSNFRYENDRLIPVQLQPQQDPELELIRVRSQLYREASQQKQQSRTRQQQRLNQAGFYQDFDADLGFGEVRFLNGSICRGRIITNTSIERGQSVRVTKAPGTIQIDQKYHKPHEKAIANIYIPNSKKYNLWMLVGSHILALSIEGNTAIVKLLYSDQRDLNGPLNQFHESEPGLCRISDTVIYMPFYNDIRRQDFATRSSEIVLGDLNRQTSNLRYTYSSSSLPSKDFYVATEYKNNNYYLSHFNEAGLVDEIPISNSSDPWSFAAISKTKFLMVRDYGIVSLLDTQTGIERTLFISDGSNLVETPDGSPGLGSIIDGFKIVETSYVFADPIEQAAYVVGLIEDPNLNQNGYPLGTVNLLQEIEVPAEVLAKTSFYNAISRIVEITGDFSKVVPGDEVLALDGNQFGIGTIAKVLSNTRAYLAQNGFGFNSNPNCISGVRRRKFITTIWKVSAQGEVSTYYRFPADETITSVAGYKYIYNLPCRGAIIDSKTKDIYLHGTKFLVVEDGWFLGQKHGFEDRTIVRITKEKKLQPLSAKLDPAMADEDKQTVLNNWDWFAQLEASYD